MDSIMQEKQTTELFKKLKLLDSSCAAVADKEFKCDLMKGADHEECQRAYLKTEDCYQRVLCAEAWQEALSCVKSKPREACLKAIQRSRACKDKFFAQMLTPQLKEHLSVVVKASQDCERDQLRLMNCSERLSPHNKECLDREIIYQQCYLGQIVPTDLWREWKQCEKANPDNSTTHCRFELENIRVGLSKRAEVITKSLDFNQTDIKDQGGHDATVDFMTAVIRGSHYASIFKDFDPRRDVFARMTKKAVEAPK